MLRAALLAVVLLAVAAAPASALTVTEQVFCDHGKYQDQCGDGPELRIIAFGPGPEDRGPTRIVVERRDGAVHVRDGLNEVRPAGGCWSASRHEAICPGGAPRALVYGSGGSDRIDLIGYPATVFAGAGDDILIGSDGDDHLSGNDGADVLVGGGGDDRLMRGEGGYPTPHVPDTRIDGGPGRDMADFFNGPHVDVDLARGTVDGAAVLAGIEDVYGGTDLTAEGSRILGDAGPNLLIGHSSSDELDGRDGDDTLLTGSGDDVARGGAGDDLVDVGGPDAWQGGPPDHGADRIACGTGGDEVRDARRRDRVAPDCERRVLNLRVTRLGAGGLRVRLRQRCNCRVLTLTIVDPVDHRVLGRRRVSGARAPWRPIRVPLNREGRRRLGGLANSHRVFVAVFRDALPAGGTDAVLGARAH
jgi:hypothetical protein